MDFSGLDLSRIARALSQLESDRVDLVDAFFERTEMLELCSRGAGPELSSRREDGFSLRLTQANRTWSASRDGLSPELFAAAYRQVARTVPAATVPLSTLAFAPWEEAVSAEPLLELPERLHRRLRERRVGFPLELTVRRHRRRVQVVGTQVIPRGEQESYYSVSAAVPGGRYGTLLCSLEESEAVHVVADALVELFRCRDTAPPSARRGVVVLGPPAAAVFLHEAVAHTLEADVLAISGDPAQAIGLELGSPLLDLIDDPAGAPDSVTRHTDDEGVPVVRRWLLRQGRVEQLIADRRWAEKVAGLSPGAGRRGDRHSLPAPRSSHLELLAGTTLTTDLFAEANGGIYLEQATRGLLDPITGRFWIEAPWARRIGPSGLEERLGKCRLEGLVVDLLAAVTAVGCRVRSEGAGWCAKGGQKVPVWATTPGLRLENVEVAPA